MNEGFVISDLHLLSWRSQGQERFERLAPKLANVDSLVLNGDIFDFRWAARPHSETIPEACEWLAKLQDEFPHLEIFYVSGNHDCLAEFISLIEAWPGISYHPHFLALGKNLFLHGDAANYQMDLNRFERFRKYWENDAPRGRGSTLLYDFSDAIGLSEVTHKIWFYGDVAVRRVGWHLDQVVPDWKETIESCFFGHTHVPLSDITYQGVSFFNTGSGIRGMGFSPQRFCY